MASLAKGAYDISRALARRETWPAWDSALHLRVDPLHPTLKLVESTDVGLG
jgi:hypothetical protein